MPAQAFALKKYRCGTSPVSKISDNEDTTASLGNSEVLSVQHSVGPPVPEFFQPSEDGRKVPPFVRRQDTRDVFPHDPTGPCCANKLAKSEGQVSTRVLHSLSESGDRERLARCSSDQNIDWSVSLKGSLRYPGNVAKVGRLGVVVLEDSAGERFDF
jgi:hypothetical protein